MKATKPILLALAGAWIALMLLEKSTDAAGAFVVRKKAWPVRAGHHSVRFFKTLLLVGLAILNIFMAVSLIGDKER